MAEPLIERLRAECYGHPHATLPWTRRLLHDAADELTRLTAQRDELREALGAYLYETTHLPTPITVGGREYIRALIPYSAVKEVRTALANTEAA